jgi:hypothetical protein
MQQHDATGLGPSAPKLIDDRFEHGLNLLVVGLIRQMLYVGATFSVVANGSAEQHDCPATRQHRPSIRSSDREFLVG